MSEYDLSESEVLCSCCFEPKRNCHSQEGKIIKLEAENERLKANWQELREVVELAKMDLRLAITEQLPYDEICNGLYELFKRKMQELEQGK